MEDERIVLTKEERDFSYELDAEILRERAVAGVDLTTYVHDRVDKEEYKRAKRRLYHENSMKKNPEAVRKSARDSYHKHKEQRRQKQKQYYEYNREEILEQKQGYYQTNRDEILQKRRDSYIPHPVEVIDSELAEHRRQKSKVSYHKNKDSINARRRDTRKAIKELWNNMNKQTFTMDNGLVRELIVVEQKTMHYASTNIDHRISKVIDTDSTPISLTKTRVTFGFKFVFEEIDLNRNEVVSVRFISPNVLNRDYAWYNEIE
jgi:2C-methyl-D-erythritol 2,4-cyclodiphosphate synthase